MYPIQDKFSAILWANVVTRAAAGNEADRADLEAENKIRQENGQPTVEEELQALIASRQK
jgi:hypothetical protein